MQPYLHQPPPRPRVIPRSGKLCRETRLTRQTSKQCSAREHPARPFHVTRSGISGGWWWVSVRGTPACSSSPRPFAHLEQSGPVGASNVGGTANDVHCKLAARCEYKCLHSSIQHVATSVNILRLWSIASGGDSANRPARSWLPCPESYIPCATMWRFCVAARLPLRANASPGAAVYGAQCRTMAVLSSQLAVSRPQQEVSVCRRAVHDVTA